ncbi:MAG: hypothetical protein ACK56I_06200, partial [bacterium]
AGFKHKISTSSTPLTGTTGNHQSRWPGSSSSETKVATISWERTKAASGDANVSRTKTCRPSTN